MRKTVIMAIGREMSNSDMEESMIPKKVSLNTERNGKKKTFKQLFSREKINYVR